MFGYIYLTTNLTNGKKYIGRKVSNVFLGNTYIGSSKDIRDEIKNNNLDKYKDFTVEIIQVCDTEKELQESERFWISYYGAVESNDFYNHHPGGNCRGSGWHHTDHFKKVMSEKQQDGKSWMCGKKHTEKTKQKMSKSRSGSKHPMYGKHHKESSKIKMSQRKLENLPKQCGSGSDNPMYGRIWVTNGTDSKPINSNELEQYESLGYYRGRTLTKK